VACALVKEQNRKKEEDALRFRRFVLFGHEAAVYSTRLLPFDAEALSGVQRCLRTDGGWAVESIIEAVAPALFALAMACSPRFADTDTNKRALSAVPRIVRNGAQLRRFAAYASALRGWGRGLRSAIARWYLAWPVGELARDMLRDVSGQGWSHADLLRLSHPEADSAARNALFRWAVEGGLGPAVPDELRAVQAVEWLKTADEEREAVRLVEDYRLHHDWIPAKWRRSAAIWETLLGTLSYSAMVRHLTTMAEAGLLAPQSVAAALVVTRLADRERIARSHIHPVSLLSARYLYAAHPQAVKHIMEALDAAIEPVRSAKCDLF
jgi:60 kDa SS-A/Ro ribonucleoprotein